MTTLALAKIAYDAAYVTFYAAANAARENPSDASAIAARDNAARLARAAYTARETARAAKRGSK